MGIGGGGDQDPLTHRPQTVPRARLNLTQPGLACLLTCLYIDAGHPRAQEHLGFLPDAAEELQRFHHWLECCMVYRGYLVQG